MLTGQLCPDGYYFCPNVNFDSQCISVENMCPAGGSPSPGETGVSQCTNFAHQSACSASCPDNFCLNGGSCHAQAEHAPVCEYICFQYISYTAVGQFPVFGFPCST
jgi:hypothetical protein